MASSIVIMTPTIKLSSMYSAMHSHLSWHRGMGQHCLSQMLQNLNSLFYDDASLLEQGHRCTCLKWCTYLFYVWHALGTLHVNFFIQIPIGKGSLYINYLAKKPKWSTIRSRMQKVMLLTTGEQLLEKLTPGTWLYPNSTRCSWYTPLHLILKTHLFLMHLQLGDIRLLLVMRHTSCFFMSKNSLQIAFCYFLQESLLGWFHTSWNIWGSLGADLMLLWLGQLGSLNFWWHFFLA